MEEPTVFCTLHYWDNTEELVQLTPSQVRLVMYLIDVIGYDLKFTEATNPISI